MNSAVPREVYEATGSFIAQAHRVTSTDVSEPAQVAKTNKVGSLARLPRSIRPSSRPPADFETLLSISARLSCARYLGGSFGVTRNV